MTPWKHNSDQFLVTTPPLSTLLLKEGEISNRKTYSMKGNRRPNERVAKILLRSLKLCLIVIEAVVNLGARSGYSIPVCCEG
jgi:hypothetical protein